jgi:hypothetical protein
LYSISSKSGFEELFSKSWQTRPATPAHKVILIPKIYFWWMTSAYRFISLMRKDLQQSNSTRVFCTWSYLWMLRGERQKL